MIMQLERVKFKKKLILFKLMSRFKLKKRLNCKNSNKDLKRRKFILLEINSKQKMKRKRSKKKF